MVSCMALYNTVLRCGGFDYRVLSAAVLKAMKEYLFAVPAAFFLGTRCSKFMAMRFTPERWKSWCMPYAISFFTVIVMVPVMTCILWIMQAGLTVRLPLLFKGIMLNYLFAMPVQVLLVGPIVRSLFTFIYPASMQPRD